MRRLYPVLAALSIGALIFTAGMQVAIAATSDPRMQVDIMANPDEPGQSLKELHADIRHAADLALQQLWQRIVPQQFLSDVPAGKRAIRFLKRAQPTADGVRIIFNEARVFDYLEAQHIPVIPRQPTWNLQIHLRNSAGQSMSQSAALLQDFANEQAAMHGYALSTMGDAMIMQWRWLDGRQVSLSVRGTSRLGEFQETRTLAPGDPLPQLQQWLTETLAKARDAYATMPETPEVPAQTVSVDVYGNPMTGIDPYAQQADPYSQLPAPTISDTVTITVQHPASLPEQVLFEDDLRKDPRVTSLIPRQLSRTMQQYRLKLKEPGDEQWLNSWFSQHGLTLTPTPDGWLAQ